MGYKSYEADKDGRIYVYPSPDVPVKKISYILKVFIGKLIAVGREKKGKSLQRE